MLNEGVVGQQGYPALSASTVQKARLGKQADQIASELHGRYYEQSYNKNTFFVANQAVVTTTVGLATTYTGLCLSNAFTNQVNLVILQCSWMQSVIQSTQVEGFGLATGFNAATNVTHTTPITPQTAFVGSGATPKALADSSATLPTAPVYTDFLGNTATATQNGLGGYMDIGGAIILAPGAYLCFVTPTQASVAGMWFAVKWEEVPV